MEYVFGMIIGFSKWCCKEDWRRWVSLQGKKAFNGY